MDGIVRIVFAAFLVGYAAINGTTAVSIFWHFFRDPRGEDEDPGPFIVALACGVIMLGFAILAIWTVTKI